MSENASVPFNRIERVLATVIGALLVLSILAIALTMIGAGTGAATGGGVWPALLLIGYTGLPLAFLLVVVFLVVSTARRRRLGRGR